MPGDAWASDVPISHPAPITGDQPALVDFGGFSFSTGGIVHDLNEAEIEEKFAPTYSPRGSDGIR